jgi:hypothetical protein
MSSSGPPTGAHIFLLHLKIILNNMTENEILLALKNSQFWNAAYNNYDATSRAAKDELAALGYEPSSSGNLLQGKILVGFREPDYRHGFDWQAKEAKWTPILVGLQPIGQEKLEQRRKEMVEEQKSSLSYHIKQQQEYLTRTQQAIENEKKEIEDIKDRIANMDRYYIVPVNGKKYKYEVHYYSKTPAKFTDIESARQFVLGFLNEWLKSHEDEYTSLKNREEQIRADIIDSQNQLQQLQQSES